MGSKNSVPLRLPWWIPCLLHVITIHPSCAYQTQTTGSLCSHGDCQSDSDSIPLPSDHIPWNGTTPFGLDLPQSPQSPTLSIIPILSLLIAAVGLIGNVLSFLVLYAYHTSQINCGGECTARVNLLGLAVADLLVCLTSLPLGFVRRRHNAYTFMLFYTIVGPALATYFLSVSVWMVLLLSVVRYLAVCHPLTSRTWLTSQRIFRVIVIIYIIALVFHLPSFLMYTFEEESDMDFLNPSTNQTLIGCSRDLVNGTNQNAACTDTDSLAVGVTILVIERPFLANQFIEVGYYIIQIVLTNIGPFLGVVVSNVAVIRACRQSDACRRSFAETKLHTPSYKEGTPHATSRAHTMPAGQNNYLYRHANATQTVRMNHHQTPNYSTQGLIIFNPNMPSQRSLSLQRLSTRATNRVTPLLLAVIFAFLLFTAPFGIVHFTCLRIMLQMGVRLRDDVSLRNLYRALNLTVEWTNVIQLLGCACNFFLYFVVSTTFRRTTKRMCRRMCQQMRTCRTKFVTNILYGHNPHSSDSWQQDTRTNELRRALDLKFGTFYESNRWKENGISSLNRLKRIGYWLRRIPREHSTGVVDQIASAPTQCQPSSSSSDPTSRANTVHSEFIFCSCIRNDRCFHCSRAICMHSFVHGTPQCQLLHRHHHNYPHLLHHQHHQMHSREQSVQTSHHCQNCGHSHHSQADGKRLSQTVQLHSTTSQSQTDAIETDKTSLVPHLTESVVSPTEVSRIENITDARPGVTEEPKLTLSLKSLPSEPSTANVDEKHEEVEEKT